MIASPSTRPGNTSGSEARLSRSERPGSFVRSTIQQKIDVTSMISVALPSARKILFQTAVPIAG